MARFFSRNKFMTICCSVSVLVGLSLATLFIYLSPAPVDLNSKSNDEFLEAASDYLKDEQSLPLLRSVSHVIRAGSNIGEALREAGFERPDVDAVVSQSKSHYDLSKIPAGLEFQVHWQDAPEVLAIQIDFQLSKSQVLRFKRSGLSWNAALLDLPITKNIESFTGLVSSNLWDSAAAAGMDPQLIIELATVFAWQVDFNREVRPQDRWRIVVEKLSVNGKFMGWGNILAAEYQNDGELYTAVRFPQEGPKGSYFAPDGSSLRRMFLKSPIKFGRISSKFKSARFHPILKRSMPHNGVDYAAPSGTPIMSVGKGVIESAGYKGGSGIMIKVRHNSIYTTAYLHLSRIAKGIRKGTKIDQGEVIGYVGSTGLATGPHLHFSFYENNVFVDPLGRKFPSADPIANTDMNMFSNIVTAMLKILPSWAIAGDSPSLAKKDS